MIRGNISKSKGMKGDRGEKGEKGDRGEQGIPGAETQEYIQKYEAVTDMYHAFQAGIAGIAANCTVKEITIPTSAWSAEEEAVLLQADVAADGVRADEVPFVSLHESSQIAARIAGIRSVAETQEGKIRFWAVQTPSEDLYATVFLVSNSAE